MNKLTVGDFLKAFDGFDSDTEIGLCQITTHCGENTYVDLVSIAVENGRPTITVDTYDICDDCGQRECECDDVYEFGDEGEDGDD